ncbi:hypothetical protein ACPOL_6793 (plasmid) [Acidisarcina polymorpha]|uniref:Uncharacterized protein n=1 Tax=Acidisarcina polymorpha TaxID=2211140 RepID=A0A2Z5G9T6_9BACT|nr:hypothetical protein ACPOL_6793 [Acidisarcina polymorpha]
MEHKAAAAQIVFILSILRFLKYLYAPLAPSSDDPRAAHLKSTMYNAYSLVMAKNNQP